MIYKILYIPGGAGFLPSTGAIPTQHVVVVLIQERNTGADVGVAA